jgi:hypothetical protein
VNPSSEKWTVATSGNVLVPAYLALQQRGYSVRREQRAEGEELWYAENDSHQFIAEDPVLLLGLVAMVETRGDSWYAADDEIRDYLARYS